MKGIFLKNSRLLKFFLFIISVIFLSACGGVTPSTKLPAISSFTASSTSITEGEGVTLSWVTTGATTVYLGHTSESGGATGTVDSSGSKIVYPSETTVYTLNATNSIGSVNQSITVTVNPAGIIGHPIHNIVIQPGLGDLKYAVVITDTPDVVYGANAYLKIGNIGIPLGITRSLLQFELSGLPENAKIMKAELKLYQFENSGMDSFTVDVHRVTESWDKFEITWNSQPNFLAQPESSSNVSVGWHYWQSWEITSLVQEWLDGSFFNYGVVLKTTNESLPKYIKCINSFSTEDPFYYPKLEVAYFVP